jgi:CheY-like chemotaxis protein
VLQCNVETALTVSGVGGGGVSVAKILVADDNSNIQKMVGLALKDQGIDVVAVGNGEAAVRKIGDIHPDLVLADVFMPVRNGYEVCEFVKKDERFAHIPVILLVGAFDPLDEQEAQRVGAAGVLKKPFVPPDPLISMVKSALARAGVALQSEMAPAPPPAEQGGNGLAYASSEPLPARPAPMPPVQESAEPVPEEMPVRAAPVLIDESHQPVAFSSLLETPTSATKENGPEEDDDQSFMPVPRPELTEARAWGVRRQDESSEEASAEESSWRREIPEEILDAMPEEESPARAKTEAAAQITPILDEEPSQVAEPHVESAAEPVAEPVVEPAPELVAEEPSAEPEATGPESPYSSAVPEEIVASPDIVGRTTSPFDEFSQENYPGLYVEEKARQPVPGPEPVQEPLVEQEVIPPAATIAVWKEEVPKAGGLSDSRHAEGTEAPTPSEVAADQSPVAMEEPELPAEVPEPLEPLPEESPATAFPEVQPSEPPPASAASELAEESAVEEPAELAEPPAEEELPHPAAVTEAISQAASELSSEAASRVPQTSPEDVQAIVAKVLDRMNPEVLQQVSREILKPVVETLLREALAKKD